MFCLDGDGSVIMHMGSLAVVGQQGPHNFKHIIINNGAHDSVGGQPTVSDNHKGFSFGTIARGCGYKEVCTLISEKQYENYDFITELKFISVDFIVCKHWQITYKLNKVIRALR